MTFLAGEKKKTQPGQVGKHIYSPSLLWIWFQTSRPERVAPEGHAARRDPGPRGGRLPGPRRSCWVQDALSRCRDNCRLTGQDGTREVEAGAAVPEEAAASTTAPPPWSTSLFGRDLGGPRWRTPLGGAGGAAASCRWHWPRGPPDWRRGSAPDSGGGPWVVPQPLLPPPSTSIQRGLLQAGRWPGPGRALCGPATRTRLPKGV